jgi:hypothetical protein
METLTLRETQKRLKSLINEWDSNKLSMDDEAVRFNVLNNLRFINLQLEEHCKTLECLLEKIREVIE